MAWNKYRHCVNHVNCNWKLAVIFLSLFCLLPISGQDFQFDTNTDDDLHVSMILFSYFIVNQIFDSFKDLTSILKWAK